MLFGEQQHRQTSVLSDDLAEQDQTGGVIGPVISRPVGHWQVECEVDPIVGLVHAPFALKRFTTMIVTSKPGGHRQKILNGHRPGPIVPIYSSVFEILPDGLFI